MVSVYAVAHFIVDFACAFLMFRSISMSPDWYLCILVYNFCAFAMQMPMGIIADKVNRNYVFAAVGCIMVGCGFGLTATPLAAAVLIGLGNGMFHIGGSVDVLNISSDKCSALGLFVSPGAFGIFFGTLLGTGAAMPALPVVLSLVVIACLIVLTHRVFGAGYVSNAPFSPAAPPKLLIAVAFFFLVVCLRSYSGLAADFPWRGAGQWGLALVCASAFGKTIGGFLSDRFGPAKTAVFSLGIAALLFLLPQVPFAGVLAILLFNMTMPITLWATAKVFPSAKGFSFGLLTFALFIGFLPVYLGVGASPFWLVALIAAVSLGLLLAGLRGIRS